MDRPVHSAATEQGLVGGGDDGIHVLHGDVTEHHLDNGHARDNATAVSHREVMYAHGGHVKP
jgi:hypothetical protein